MPVSTIPSISPVSIAFASSLSSHLVSLVSSKYRSATNVRSRSGSDSWLAICSQLFVAIRDDIARRYGSVFEATASSKSSCPWSTLLFPWLLSCSARETKNSSGYWVLAPFRIWTAFSKSPPKRARAVAIVYHDEFRSEGGVFAWSLCRESADLPHPQIRRAACRCANFLLLTPSYFGCLVVSFISRRHRSHVEASGSFIPSASLTALLRPRKIN